MLVVVLTSVVDSHVSGEVRPAGRPVVRVAIRLPVGVDSTLVFAAYVAGAGEVPSGIAERAIRRAFGESVQ